MTHRVVTEWQVCWLVTGQSVSYATAINQTPRSPPTNPFWLLSFAEFLSYIEYVGESPNKSYYLFIMKDRKIFTFKQYP